MWGSVPRTDGRDHVPYGVLAVMLGRPCRSARFLVVCDGGVGGTCHQLDGLRTTASTVWADRLRTHEKPSVQMAEGFVLSGTVGQALPFRSRSYTASMSVCVECSISTSNARSSSWRREITRWTSARLPSMASRAIQSR